MPILFQVTTPQWLALPVETREKLRQVFKIPRTGQRSFVQVNGRGEVTSDGTTNGDLAALSLPAMAKYLGLVEVPGEEMLLTLFKKVVERVEETGESPEADEKALKENPVPENLTFSSPNAPVVDDSAPVVLNGEEKTIEPCTCGHVITVNLGWHCGIHHVSGHGIKLCEKCVPADEKPLDKMNKQELLAKAKSLELDVPEDMTKAQIVEAIKGLTNANQQP